MITGLRAGPYTLEGVSVAGVYTSLRVCELDALFDCGLAALRFAGSKRLFLSHGHADHVGALMALLGMRGLLRQPPLRVYLPAAVVEPLTQALEHLSKLQRFALQVDAVGLLPGDVVHLRGNLWLRAFETHHTCPSLGYQLFTRVNKLLPQYRSLTGPEIAKRRQRGDPLFEVQERLQFAYATDTRIEVLQSHPTLLRTRVLVLECSFLDEKKSRQAARSGGHIHLDELLEHASLFENEALVLMHFSQLHSPREVREILARRCPPALLAKIVVFAPNSGRWPGA